MKQLQFFWQQLLFWLSSFHAWKLVAVLQASRYLYLIPVKSHIWTKFPLILLKQLPIQTLRMICEYRLEITCISDRVSYA